MQQGNVFRKTHVGLNPHLGCTSLPLTALNIITVGVCVFSSHFESNFVIQFIGSGKVRTKKYTLLHLRFNHTLTRWKLCMALIMRKLALLKSASKATHDPQFEHSH